MTPIAELTPAALGVGSDPAAAIQAAVEARLAALLPTQSNARDLVSAAMRECTLAPGKRLRPLLLALTAQGLGANAQAALDLGCAVEMVHAASLVLDDMPCMDDAALRRGRITLHLAFGEDVAMLAAIALLSRAFGVIAGLEEVPGAVRSELVGILSEAVGSNGLVKGQLQDLRDGVQVRSAAEIAETNHLKTGMLFAALMNMACSLAGAPAGTQAILRDFALELGQAFQLYDDLRDSDPSNGKTPGQDAGKSTLLAICGEAAVRERLQQHLHAAEECLAQAGLGGSAIAGLVRKAFDCAAKVEVAAPVCAEPSSLPHAERTQVVMR